VSKRVQADRPLDAGTPSCRPHNAVKPSSIECAAIVGHEDIGVLLGRREEGPEALRDSRRRPLTDAVPRLRPVELSLVQATRDRETTTPEVNIGLRQRF
jgi:hypothetical protein